MEIKITKQVDKTVTIDVELPYYYKHWLDDSTIHGMIDERTHISIHAYDNDEKYEIEREHHSSIENTGLGSYFDDGYRSSKDIFELVKARCIAFCNTL